MISSLIRIIFFIILEPISTKTWTVMDTPREGCVQKTVSGDRCYFPFSFGRYRFNGCTDFAHSEFWCSLDQEFQGRWALCLEGFECFIQDQTLVVTPQSLVNYCTDRTEQGNGGGMACFFPFLYKGQEYQSCTTIDHSRYWCGTTLDSSKWGNCIYMQDCAVQKEVTIPTTVIVPQETTFPSILRRPKEATILTTPTVPTPTAPTTTVQVTPNGLSVMPPSSQVSKVYCTTRTILGKRAHGAPCAALWTYKGQNYTDCTLVDNPRPWCSITPNYSRSWGVCLTAEQCTPFCATKTYLGSANGAPCVFPFSYRGVSYNACTTIDHFSYWCATSPSYNQQQWGNCIYGTTDCPLVTSTEATTPTTTEMVTPTTPDNGAYGLYCLSRTYGGNADGAPCVSPFVYRGNTYRGCIPTTSVRKAWCSTTAVYNGQHGNCYFSNECAPFCPGSTHGGTANGVPCVFPFVYRGRTYYNCTTFDHINTLHWCSATPTYDGLWGHCIYASPCPVILPLSSATSFCKDSTIDGTAYGAPCATNWTYKGKTFSDCTFEDNPRPWCSTTPNFSGQWGVCRVGACPNVCTGSTEKGTAGGAKCVFPFTYKGVTYTTCTTADNRGSSWCSTTSVFNGSWGKCIYDVCPYCPDRTVGGTGFGAPCAPSWTYKGITYTGCIKTGRNRFWCSTTEVYNGFWGECLDPDCKRFCADRTELGSAGGVPCVFPFSYKGTVYNSCTSRDHFRLWCATTEIYDVNNWGNCLYEC